MNDILESLKNLYDESYSANNETEIFNLLSNLAEKFNVSKEFINYVISQEF